MVLEDVDKLVLEAEFAEGDTDNDIEIAEGDTVLLGKVVKLFDPSIVISESSTPESSTPESSNCSWCWSGNRWSCSDNALS